MLNNIEETIDIINLSNNPIKHHKNKSYIKGNFILPLFHDVNTLLMMLALAPLKTSIQEIQEPKQADPDLILIIHVLHLLNNSSFLKNHKS